MTRQNSEATTSTAERMNTMIRREILQGVRNAANGRSTNVPETPVTPPMSSNNYNALPRALRPGALSVTPEFPSSSVRPDDSWSVSPADVYGAYYESENGSGGKHVSMAPTVNSGRRLSDITPADAEWKELQNRLNWAETADAAHVMPPLREP